MEQPGPQPWDKGKSWMQYLKDRSDPVPGPSEAVIEMLKDLDKGENPLGTGRMDKSFSQYNPYEYVSPSDKPKDLKGGPPFDGGLPFIPDQGFFFDDKVLDKEGPLREWYKARRRDWTTDPDEQQPAISILRKKLAVDKFVSRYMLENYPVMLSCMDIEDTLRYHKTASSLQDIVNADRHYKNDKKIERSGRCNAVWINRESESDRTQGLFVFKVKCTDSRDSRYVYFQFMNSEDNKKGMDYTQVPVKISCSCPSFLWYGAQYYAIQDNYIYWPGFRVNPSISMTPKGPKEYVIHKSPKYPEGKRHPGRGFDFRVCKHILAAYTEIKKMKIVRPYKKFPDQIPPSKIQNKDVWKNMMKFDFTEEEIKDRLKKGKAPPNYFQRFTITRSIIDWFYNTWIPLSDAEKMEMIKKTKESPERIFFWLAEEAYLRRSKGMPPLSNKLIDDAYQVMADVVQPDNDLEPEQAKMPGVPEDQKVTGKGTIPEKQIEEPAKGPSKVEPKTKPVEPSSDRF